jgi:SAM-dependent methyltransferase
MVRFCGILSASVLLLCGCAEASKPAAPTANGPRAASSESAAAAENSPPEDAAATSAVPAGETPAAPAESKTDATSGAKELNLEVISFTAPGTWKQVKPANNIIEAEFELPRAAGDEYDGRLTLMSAGGDPEDIIGRRTAEFDRDADDAPKRETLSRHVARLDVSAVESAPRRVSHAVRDHSVHRAERVLRQAGRPEGNHRGAGGRVPRVHQIGAAQTPLKGPATEWRMDFPEPAAIVPTRERQDALFFEKYGPPEDLPWPPRNRRNAGYFLPADVYEGVVAGHVDAGTEWLDVGGGHELFPHNPALSARLAAHCQRLAVVDPSSNVHKNRYAHERVQSVLENFQPDRPFDLMTLRMVVEHVEDPDRFVTAVHDCLRPGGRAIVFTVNARSPLSLVSRFTPFWLHYPIKKLFWSYRWEGIEKEDTFPAYYRMNTRRRLTGRFERAGFRELAFYYLDDLSTFGKFRLLNGAELWLWKLLRRCGLRYPENCLLGVYERAG